MDWASSRANSSVAHIASIKNRKSGPFFPAEVLHFTTSSGILFAYYNP
jgi:hypothetical protein